MSAQPKTYRMAALDRAALLALIWLAITLALFL